MTTAVGPTEIETAITATYDEFRLCGQTVGTISDPDNGRAWIQSDVVEQIEP